MTLNAATLDRLTDEVVVLLVLLENHTSALIRVDPDFISQAARVHDVLRKVGVKVQRSPAVLLAERDISLTERRRVLDAEQPDEIERRRAEALKLALRFRVNEDKDDDD